MQTNNSKEKVRQLQNKLYLTAKKCDSRRFHALYDKVYRDDVLYEAWKRVKANKGTSGVDGITIEEIETKGVPEYLTEIQAGNYDEAITLLKSTQDGASLNLLGTAYFKHGDKRQAAQSFSRAVQAGYAPAGENATKVKEVLELLGE